MAIDFNADQNRMGLALLAAAGPSARPMSFGQRMFMGMGQHDQYLREKEAQEMLRKAREAQLAFQQMQMSQMIQQQAERKAAQERAAQLEKQLADAAEKQKALVTQNDIAAKAAKLGIIDPDAAYRLLDTSKLEYAEDGKPSNTEVLLQALLKDKPYLAGGGSSAMNPAKRAVDDIDPVLLAARKAAGLGKGKQ